jgi:LAO/AO transport system kinase
VTPSAEIEALGRRVLEREANAVARAISVVEDRRSVSEATVFALLRYLADGAPPLRSHRVGFTGPPGVGKSSLVSAFATTARRAGKTVGVLAVDPSSPRSGGALLGDRARIDIDPDDQGLFVRSMASGGELGGLARAAGAAVEVLSAAYDMVIIETTGVGQSETDVEHVADTVVMVIQPGSGDVLQFLKAGIIEIPDLFVVNKADLGAIAQRAVADLQSALSAVHVGSAANESGVPSVLTTSATTAEGVKTLFDLIEARRMRLEQSGALGERRRQAAARWALRLYAQRFGDHGLELAGGRGALGAELLGRIEAGATPVEAVALARAAHADG